MEQTQLMRIKQQLKSAPQCPPWNPDVTPGPPSNSFIKSAIGAPYPQCYQRKPRSISARAFNSTNEISNKAKGDLKHNLSFNQKKRVDVVTSPHLKYGLFPAAKNYPNTRQCSAIISSSRQPKSRNNMTKEIKAKIQIAPMSYTLTQKTLQLSASEIMHLDIIPKISRAAP